MSRSYLGGPAGGSAPSKTIKRMSNESVFSPRRQQWAWGAEQRPVNAAYIR